MPVPPPDSAPTFGEVLRNLEQIRRIVEETARAMREDRDRADLRFVPRGEWKEGRETDRSRVNDVAQDVEELKAKEVAAAASRRQFLFGLALTAITSVAGFLTALAVLLLGKG